MRLRRTRRRTTGGGQGCYHDVDDVYLVDSLVVVVVLQNQFASGMWRTQRCAPGRSRWPPCQGTDSSRLRGCRLCNNDVVAEVVFIGVMLLLFLVMALLALRMDFNHAIPFYLQNSRQPMKIKKKKTSGYAIFCRWHKTVLSTSRIVFGFVIR